VAEALASPLAPAVAPAVARPAEAAGDTAVVRLRGVRKTYNLGMPNESEVLHGIDMTVRHGEFCAVVGPSGSGKSTLLNIVGLLDRATAGTVEVCGEQTTVLDDGALTRLRGQSIGFVFQQHHLITAFSALENVMLPMLGAEGFANDAMRVRAEALIASVGLTAWQDNGAGKLSGGQQQRVAIARALAMGPALLLARRAGREPRHEERRRGVRAAAGPQQRARHDRALRDPQRGLRRTMRPDHRSRRRAARPHWPDALTPMDFKDYYATLGVERSATQAEIKRAYRKLARKFHPDVSSEPDAEARFKEVAEAHEALIDVERRAAYDEIARRHATGQPFEAPAAWGGDRAAPVRMRPRTSATSSTHCSGAAHRAATRACDAAAPAAGRRPDATIMRRWPSSCWTLTGAPGDRSRCACLWTTPRGTCRCRNGIWRW
jgi:lipoprotein-releasing system ATP-binding protein